MSEEEKLLSCLKEVHEGMKCVGILGENNADDVFGLLMEEEDKLVEKLRKLRRNRND